MTVEAWFEISARIVAGAPAEIDDVLFDDLAGKPAAGGCPDNQMAKPWILPSKALWKQSASERVAIGVKVTEPMGNAVQIATQLVAMAIERGITPVILSSIPISGFEQYGFRVERLAGATPAQQAICEEELKQFWDIAVVVNAQDILNMG
ncbi:MAG: hypothetical protein V3U96_02195 [Paracoccaceae bacterium]